MSERKKLLVSLAVLCALNVLLIWVFQGLPSARAAEYRRGGSGETVKTIQEKLQDGGYYDGALDGDFGPKTEAAVRAFQQGLGLPADGVAGARTLYALGVDAVPGGAQMSERAGELELLARLICAEARDEPYAGQVAVGAVVLNRLRDPLFPNTLAGVVYQRGAFACLTDGRFDRPVSDTARRAAQAAMNGADLSGGALYFFERKGAPSPRLAARPVLNTIGRFCFC
ncbi:MAG: cell wall hydrolase [Oscillospiraceae bacterium]|jgi:N-acetylmuramoyl-L-alanine amidase|nr:cell wall hydrolase [Oscillospiraceae bacterium]